MSASVCALAGSLALAVPGAAATAAVARPASQAAYRTFPDRLYGVKAISATDVWAVGLAPTSSLILHWNGRAWSQSHPLAGLGYYNGGLPHRHLGGRHHRLRVDPDRALERQLVELAAR